MSADCSGTVATLRVRAGMAGAVARRIRAAGDPAILGVIADRHTVLAVVRPAEAERVMDWLRCLWG
ncbi:hypothetical protein [Acetonema longum]|uniref:Arginine repressor C-terminal domain-containing protein n=1 Tax=Acetonema longum DSM 6540 TaxID=1009370 RepID=F7NE12_9FIRM|nr:hypothetical protein [Acetonema longum]EGO65667.1 hypothetical protein ALO_01374 [Acetonema longum DSM 6540]